MTVALHYLAISDFKSSYYLNQCFAVTLKNLQAAMVFHVLSVPMSKMSFLYSDFYNHNSHEIKNPHFFIQVIFFFSPVANR